MFFQMVDTSRRRILSIIAAGVTAGCVGSPPDSESPNPTITQINEIEPPDNTPTPANEERKTASRSTLFEERPSEDAVIVARTIITNGCRRRKINHTRSSPQNYTISLNRVSRDLGGMTCQATFGPSPYAIKITFDELEDGMDISINTFGDGGQVGVNKTFSYTTTGTQTKSIVRASQTIASHDDGAARP